MGLSGDRGPTDAWAQRPPKIWKLFLALSVLGGSRRRFAKGIIWRSVWSGGAPIESQARAVPDYIPWTQ